MAAQVRRGVPLRVGLVAATLVLVALGLLASGVAVTTLLPIVLRSFFTYNLTYGSLAGIMIALFFFWLVGLGVVIGAELNAALAETPEEEMNTIGQADNRRRNAAAENQELQENAE